MRLGCDLQVFARCASALFVAEGFRLRKFAVSGVRLPGVAHSFDRSSGYFGHWV
jgi:hypothetical protein